jgi:redox-sensitive bicupin YhaK (pirin superfamily)
MISIRKSNERGLTEIDWLKSYHTFSFGGYNDPQYRGCGSLRVINQDSVQPGKGFEPHQHADMEIISYVIEGALEHKDSMGTGSIIKPGEIQRMSAGGGVAHSEFNASQSEGVHFLQIWIIPNTKALKPSYEQKSIPQSVKNALILIGSPNSIENAVLIHQDVDLYVAYLNKNKSISHVFLDSRLGWIQVIKGQIKINDAILSQGDGAKLSDEKQIKIEALAEAEFLLFDIGHN